MTAALTNSLLSWEAYINGDLACILGIAPPTMLSSRAYIWLYHTFVADRHRFLLVRHSQILVKKLLQEYEVLVGHCVIDDKARTDKSIRWLKWLGAEFLESDGRKVEFWIRRGDG